VSVAPARDPRIGVIFLVPDRWRGIWMPRHQVAHRLARHFEVVWIEEARPWRDYWGPKARDEVVIQDVRTDFPGFTVYDPGRWLPEVYKPRWLRDLVRRRRVRAALDLLRAKGCSRVVTYAWRPDFAWALDAFRADLTCYHVDDEYSFTTSDQPIDAAEAALLRRADQVFIHSSGLLRKKGGLNANTMHVPNGVDFPAYSNPAPEPSDLAAIPHPRIGYVGVVKAQLDLQLLLTLARRNPQWSFVIVGPRGFLGNKSAILDEMATLPNVYQLGNRAVKDLPAYVQSMDVCVMPYEVSDYTNFIYPMKLHEYLATGRPSVASPITSIVPFGDVVWLASNPDEWQAALVKALAPEAKSTDSVRARRKRAAEHDWDLLVDRIAVQLKARLQALASA
jgi:glycosyltransferase involved in cell wall biosynthesis